MARGDKYQIVLIVSGIIATLLFGLFFMREMFPEYKIYQEDYVELEQFRSTYTHEPPPTFKFGVKQIVLEAPDKGPPTIDRCTSCHVALQFEHFSPTKIAYDVNGQIIRDVNGFPEKVPNENYVWKRLEDRIADLLDPAVIGQLKAKGEWVQVDARESEAAHLRALKTAEVGDHVYDVTKALRMHPLIGRETRPFEFHPIEEYGCTVCHNGNGRGLTTEKAHGPVFDGDYTTEFMGYKPEFLEKDADNDPLFSRVFNDKPGHELLFQTTPIFVGGLIESNCVQCHQSAGDALRTVSATGSILFKERERRSRAIEDAYTNQKSALISVVRLIDAVHAGGLDQTLQALQKLADDYALPVSQREEAAAQIDYLKQVASGGQAATDVKRRQTQALSALNEILVDALGSPALADKLLQALSGKENAEEAIDSFVAANKSNPQAKGTFFIKADSAQYNHALAVHIEESQSSFENAADDETVLNAMTRDVDLLTSHYHNGENLFLSQACYACHRIAGYSRGGVGPELTREGESYPWFVKESIIWPQADLKTSTMPNFKLDHEDVEDLLAYLLAQKGQKKAVAEAVYKISLADWEAGKKLPWEKPVTPAQMRDVEYGMTVFATQGCAACHRLKGFQSDVGYAVEKNAKPSFSDLHRESNWFQQLFPEDILGTEIVQTLERHAGEIDSRIVSDVRKDALLNRLEQTHEGLLESFYSPFKYAFRAKNKFYQDLIDRESEPRKKQALEEARKQWQERVRRVLMVFIQEYGLGRLVGPRPNWSGVYRSDEWLMEHFRSPTSHVPRSIMPVFPFDDTKFYALTYMLDILGIRNRDSVRQIWDQQGFNPSVAYQIYCSQCHGPHLQGNGPVAEWIYPIPKNLRNAHFLRNLTREQAINSITHGVKGTPMPPWGETFADKPQHDGIPVLNEMEIRELTEWLFHELSGEQLFDRDQDTPKWQYEPEDVIKELKQEGNKLKGAHSAWHCLPRHYLADNGNTIPPASDESEVTDIFEMVRNPVTGENQYYIKKQYYTPENIAAGEAFFQLNCAVCHGQDAAGTGTRAGVMQDAKPRILTNLDWLHTRDDLRLLRSIKYGVLGTSMTPWGDLTSSLQRLQLVIYIRSLSEENVLRGDLTEALYQSFDVMAQQILHLRASSYPQIDALSAEYAGLEKLYRSQTKATEDGVASIDTATALYKKKIELSKQLKEDEATDALLGNVRNLVKREGATYQDMGLQMIQQNPKSPQFPLLINAIKANANRYLYKEGKLAITFDEKKIQEIASIENQLLGSLDKEIEKTKLKLDSEKGKIPSAAVQESTHELQEQLKSLVKLRRSVQSGFEEAKRLRNEQKQLLEEYAKRIKPATPNQS